MTYEIHAGAGENSTVPTWEEVEAEIARVRGIRHHFHIQVRKGDNEMWSIDRTGVISHTRRIPEFPADAVEISERDVVYPLRGHGVIPAVGWDIGSPWLVDATGTIWANTGGHGGPMKILRDPERLISEFMLCDDEDGANELRTLVGMKTKRPSWMTTAMRAGWTPPASWVDPEI